MRRLKDLLMASTVTITLLLASCLNAEQMPLDRAVQTMSHKVTTIDQELATLKSRFENQDRVLDSIHKEVTLLIKATKDSQATALSSSDNRQKALEKNLEKLVSDLKQFKKHANESSTTISQLQKSLQKQDELIQLQAQQIKDLESAMRHLASAMQPSKAAEQATAYRVKAGDTLEKIAKEHGTSVEALKAKNNLRSNTIFTGQKLQIP